MNLEETVALLQALRSNGAKYYKSSELEVMFSDSKEAEVLTMKTPKLEPNIPDPASNYNPIATKQAEDLLDILKMKDEELVNKLFPAGS